MTFFLMRYLSRLRIYSLVLFLLYVIVGVSEFVGMSSLESFILPLTEDALSSKRQLECFFCIGPLYWLRFLFFPQSLRSLLLRKRWLRLARLLHRECLGSQMGEKETGRKRQRAYLRERGRLRTRESEWEREREKIREQERGQRRERRGREKKQWYFFSLSFVYRKHILFQIANKVAPMLCHHNVWIRAGVISIFDAIAQKLTAADTFCFLIPVMLWNERKKPLFFFFSFSSLFLSFSPSLS